MTILIRPARTEDAQAMCEVLNPIIAEGTTTAWRAEMSPDAMAGHLIAPLRVLSCLLAIEGAADAKVLGIQMLEWADPDWNGEPAYPADWALISTFVSLGQQGRGIGQTLWAATTTRAREAGARGIGAVIRDDNIPGLRYYSRLGFADHAEVDMPLSDGTPSRRICKGYPLPGQA